MEPKPLRVLLIEHDADAAARLGALLSQSTDDAPVLTVVPSLQAAIKQVGAAEFDLILLEFFLPDGAGLLNIPILRERAPRVPVVVLGSSDDEAISVEAVQAGAQDYLAAEQLTPHWLRRSIRYAVERHRADLALVDAKERYRGLFDHLVEGIFQTTSDGRYLLANATLARIYGYASPEELMASVTDIGQRLYVQPKRREEFQQIMEQYDTITGFESQIFRKDGSIIWISENCRAVRDATGKLIYYEGTVEDITLLREAQENLRASETLYHSLVDTMPQCIFRKDLSGRYTFVNKQFCRITGRSLNEMIGKTIFDIYPEHLARQREADDQNVMSSGKVLEQIEENQFPGGEEKFIHVLKMPIFDAGGQVIGLQGMFWDITKEREMEQALRKSEALYHSLVETMPQNVFRKDLQGRFTFANQQYCQHYHCTLEDILGKTDFDFFPRELAEKYKADDIKVMTTGQTYDIVEEHHPLGQEKTFVQVVKTPLYGPDGKISGLQGIFWDITEQKRAEAQIRRANQELARSREALHQQNVRMQDDLKMASEIQLTMLPQQYPVFPPQTPPASSALAFAHRYLPSQTVGGDFFTVSPLSDTEAAVLICDVAGHGVRSALVTAMIRALVEELKPLAANPGEFLSKLNSELSAILRHAGAPIMTTAFYLVADATDGRLRYASAGHPKPILLRRDEGRLEVLKVPAKKPQPALGLFERAVYETGSAALSPHDVVLLFTDGLYEAQSPGHDLYSEELLAASVVRHHTLDTPALLDKIVAEVRSFAAKGEFQDDVCVVGVELVKVLGPGVSSTKNRV